MSKIRIQIDEIEAEMTAEQWIDFKSKVMKWMLNGTVGWEEGCAMRSIIDSQLAKHCDIKAVQREMLTKALDEMSDRNKAAQIWQSQQLRTS